MRLVCPACKGPLESHPSARRCARCDRSYAVVDDIVDFVGLANEDVPVPEEDVAGLQHEHLGASARIQGYYLPLLRKAGAGPGARILDCGCGNGASVEELRGLGFDAWGLDNAPLRRSQWSRLGSRAFLVVADGRSMPFATGSFDYVLCSGVLEHVGVTEFRHEGRYHVAPAVDRDEHRAVFWAELQRVVRSGGVLWLDFPNGLLPFDFWHGDHAGQARRHGRDEGFLPTPREVRALLRGAAKVTALSPAGRLGFQQVGSHWYGRMLRWPAAALLEAMRLPGLRWLSETRLNPFLVYEIENR